MNTAQFVEGVRESVVDSNLKFYIRTFNETKLDQVTDDYWKSALLLFQSLTIEQQEVFFKIIRQVEVDLVSKLFSVLDGGSFLDAEKSEFLLTSKGSGENINEGLQDVFLELEEDCI